MRRRITAVTLLVLLASFGLTIATDAETWSGPAAYYDASYSSADWCWIMTQQASWGNAVDGWTCDPNGYYAVYPGLPVGSRLQVTGPSSTIWVTIGDQVWPGDTSGWLDSWAIELSWTAFRDLGLQSSNWVTVSTGVTPEPSVEPVVEPSRWFPETGQSLGGGFLTFWEERGGLVTFGYPLTGEFVASDTGLTTQCLERVTLEIDPRLEGEWRVRGRFVEGGCPIESSPDPTL